MMEKIFPKMDSKGQVSGLLGLIAIVAVGGIISIAIFSNVLSSQAAFSSNATLLSVQNTFMPLFVLAGVAGAVIAVLLYGFGGRR